MKSLSRTAVSVLLTLGVSGSLPASAQLLNETPSFRYSTNAFWLNLHQFLYVLGRAHSNAPDATKSAVATALPDEERGLKNLRPDELAAWNRSVELYVKGLSSLDAELDETLISAAQDLANAADAPSLIPTTRIDRSTREALEIAAPLYRKTFWPTHYAANQRWQAGMERALAGHQRSLMAFLSRAFGLSWPRDGALIHVAAYANSAGGFGVPGPLVIMSSVAPEMRGAVAIETMYHEVLHRWDDSLQRRLQLAAAGKKVTLDDWLAHALVTYTAAEAVRRVVPSHVSIAETNRLWVGRERLRQAVISGWKPWLDGKGGSQDAIENVVVRAGSSTAPAPARRRR